MKATIASLAFLAAILVTSPVNSSERHVKADLVPNGSTGVTGFVIITQLPEGSNVNVVARGLVPGNVYTSFYYESTDCTEPADSLETFTADDNGEGHANGKIDDDLDEVGSVSVRIGPGYGDLQACATIH